MAYLLKAEQQHKQQQQQLGGGGGGGGGAGKVPSIPLRQRIENLLTLPDERVYTMSEQDMKTHVALVVELYIEQEKMLNGRKAQLM